MITAKQEEKKVMLSWNDLLKETAGHVIHIRDFIQLVSYGQNLTLSAWSKGSKMDTTQQSLCAITLNNVTFVFFHDKTDSRLMCQNVCIIRKKLNAVFQPCAVDVVVEEAQKNLPMFSFRAKNTKEILLGFGTELGDFNDVYGYPVTVFHVDPDAIDRSLKKELFITLRKKSAP